MAVYPNSQSNPGAAIPVWIAPAPAAAGLTASNITANGNHLLKTGSGSVKGLSINTGVAGSTVKIYDGIDATGKLLGTFSTSDQNAFPLNLPFSTGLFVVTASGGSAADITITYF